MKVNIDNVNQLVSHILVNDETVCSTVADTEEWKKNGIINCEVLFNGIKVDGSVLENTLQHFVKSIEEQFAKKYDAERLDKVIEERAQELLKEHADNALEKLQDLSRKLEEIDDVLVPHWERNN